MILPHPNNHVRCDTCGAVAPMVEVTPNTIGSGWYVDVPPGWETYRVGKPGRYKDRHRCGTCPRKA